MEDFFSEMVDAPAAQPAQGASNSSAAPAEFDFFEELTSSGPSKKVGAAGGYDRTGEVPNVGFFDQMRANMPVSTADKIKRYSQITGIPVDKFGVIEGRIVAFDGGRYVPVEPIVGQGDGVTDKFRRAGEFVGAGTPGTVPGIVGGLAGITQGNPITGAAVAGGTAATLDMGRQALDRALAGEDVTDIDYLNSAGQGGLAGISEFGGYGLAKLFTRNRLGIQDYDRLKALDPQFLKDAETLRQKAKTEFGIDLSTGQATGLRSILAKERQALRWDETMDDVYKFRDTQWGDQIPAAVQKEIRRISPKSGEDAVSAFRSGSDDVVAAAEKKWMDEAKVSFSNALDNKPPYNTEQLDVLMKRPIMAAAWKEAKIAAQNRGRPLPEYFQMDEAGNIIGNIQKPDWRAWHSIKMGLDRVKNNNLNAMGRPSGKGADAAAVKKDLMRELRVNQEYMDALRNYGESADVMDAILSGGVGYLKKMKQQDVAGVVNRVFNENNIPFEEINRMRQTFASIGQSPKWNAGVSRWLSDALDGALKETAGGSGNVPNAFLKKVYGSPERKRIFEAALGPENMKRWEGLLEVLQAAKKSLPEGSPTATDLGALAPDAVGEAAAKVGGTLSIDVFDNAGKGIANLRQPEARVRLAKFLFSPQGIKELKKLRMLSKTGHNAVRLFGDLATKAGIVGTGDLLGLGNEVGQDPRGPQ